MTSAEFKAFFPEFTRADDALVTSRIGWATLRTPADMWGPLQEQGIGFLVAHMLALLPEAKNLRKNASAITSNGLDQTTYGRERKRLNTLVASGFRTAGVPVFTADNDGD